MHIITFFLMSDWWLTGAAKPYAFLSGSTVLRPQLSCVVAKVKLPMFEATVLVKAAEWTFNQTRPS